MVGNIYRPPAGSNYLPSDFNAILRESISLVLEERKETILLGDLNCDYLDVNTNKELKELLCGYGLNQIIHSATRITKHSKTLIDVILSTNPERIVKSIVIPSSISDHDMVGFVRLLHTSKFKQRSILTRCFKNYNHIEYNEDMKNAPWEEVYNESNVNSAWQQMKEIVVSIMNKTCPINST